jgi:hypothetical protein
MSAVLLAVFPDFEGLNFFGFVGMAVGSPQMPYDQKRNHHYDRYPPNHAELQRSCVVMTRRMILSAMTMADEHNLPRALCLVVHNV